MRAGFHFFAVLLEMIVEVSRAYTALPISWYGVIDELRIRQVKFLHDLNKLPQCFTVSEARVALAFLRNRRNMPVIVVVSGIHQRVTG